MTDLEGNGMPGVFVASTAFEDAALAQSRALGFDPAGVFVPHPIQDRTDDEMKALADASVEDIWARLTSDGRHFS